MRRRFLVSGEVQGVGFRHFVWQRGRRLGLLGWVRNLPDGRVEVLAEGDPARLSELETELRRGPSLANVTNLESREIESAAERFNTFEIR